MAEKPQPPGRLIEGPGGYHAFVPAPLPPAIAWNAELVSALSRADRAVGRLAGEGRLVSNPHLFIRAFLHREAVLSSRIEGTQATLGQLLAAGAGAKVDGDAADLQEVANYVVALEYGIGRLYTLPLSLRLVRELHERLMRGVRGDTAAPGEFRRTRNWIGPPGSAFEDARYVPPPPGELMGCLGAWEQFLHDDTLPPLVHAALIHSQFEAIHPFLDGNGRVGRLLISLLFVARGLLPEPLLYLSAYFEATREEYYARLQAVTENGEWEAWLTYFLRGVELQAGDAVGRIQRIDDLFQVWSNQIDGVHSGQSGKVLELFVENPFWSVRGLAQYLEVAYTTARRAVDRLEAEGIVTLFGEAKRNRVYCARAVLEVLNAPSTPRRDPAEKTRGGNK